MGERDSHLPARCPVAADLVVERPSEILEFRVGEPHAGQREQPLAQLIDAQSAKVRIGVAETMDKHATRTQKKQQRQQAVRRGTGRISLARTCLLCADPVNNLSTCPLTVSL